MVLFTTETIKATRRTKMKKRIYSLLLAGALGLTLLAGCGSKEETTEATTAVTEATTEAATTEPEEATSSDSAKNSTEAEDRAGNTIMIPDNVERIISMAPSTTQFLIDLGVADKIIAIDTNSAVYADQLPADVQQFDMMAPDNEALVALEPDIIFTSGMSNVGGDDVYQPAKAAGVCVADIPSSTSFDDIVEDLKFIGMAVHEDAKADELINVFLAQLDDLKKIGDTISEKKTVLFEISLPSEEYPSVYTFGKGTYLDEMITMIGAENVTGDQESWISISEEEAIAMNPDVIITNVNYIDDAAGVIKSSPGWENVTAVKNGDVYYIDADSSNQPNNHVIDAMVQMAKYIYPDAYKDFADPFATAGDAE